MEGLGHTVGVLELVEACSCLRASVAAEGGARTFHLVFSVVPCTADIPWEERIGLEPLLDMGIGYILPGVVAVVGVVVRWVVGNSLVVGRPAGAVAVVDRPAGAVAVVDRPAVVAVAEAAAVSVRNSTAAVAAFGPLDLGMEPFQLFAQDQESRGRCKTLAASILVSKF